MSANDQAFPGSDPSFAQSYRSGLTKREYAAIHILAGFDEIITDMSAVKDAIRLADALFEELEK